MILLRCKVPLQYPSRYRHLMSALPKRTLLVSLLLYAVCDVENCARLCLTDAWSLIHDADISSFSLFVTLIHSFLVESFLLSAPPKLGNHPLMASNWFHASQVGKLSSPRPLQSRRPITWPRPVEKTRCPSDDSWASSSFAARQAWLASTST